MTCSSMSFCVSRISPPRSRSASCSLVCGSCGFLGFCWDFLCFWSISEIFLLLTIEQRLNSRSLMWPVWVCWASRMWGGNPDPHFQGGALPGPVGDGRYSARSGWPAGVLRRTCQGSHGPYTHRLQFRGMESGWKWYRVEAGSGFAACIDIDGGVCWQGALVLDDLEVSMIGDGLKRASYSQDFILAGFSPLSFKQKKTMMLLFLFLPSFAFWIIV